MRSLGLSSILAFTAVAVLGTMPPAAQAQPFRPRPSPQSQPVMSPPSRPMPSRSFSPTIVLSPETSYLSSYASQRGYPMPYSNPSPYAMPYGGYGSYPMSNGQSGPYQTRYGDYGPSSSPLQYGYFGSSSAASAVQEEPKRIVDVVLHDNYFHPARIEIPVGTTVQWTNEGEHVHSVTSDKNPWEFSAQLGPRDVYRRTFNSPGNYPYHCTMHPVAMRGVVVVR